jgi:hypothetical protein
MAVQAASLEILEKAALPPAQARAIVQAIEIEIAGAKDTLATKHDLLLLRHELELRIEALRGDLRAEMHAIAGSGLKQMYGAILGQLAVLLGAAYFFVSHLSH